VSNIRCLRDCLKQLGGLDGKRMGKLHKVYKAEITLAAFDATDVVAVEIGALGQLFLRQAVRQPQFADSLAKQQSGILGTHVIIIRTLSLSVYTL